MNELFQFQNNLLTTVNNRWHRYLYPQLKKEERLLGLKGLRGTGKTTLLLQYLAYDYPLKEKGLYVSADHPYFYRHSLFDLAGYWYKYDGKLLLIDEVHKYPQWSRELKLIYDGYPGLQVIFTSSSALDLFRGESDLSRRLITQDLHGLSFREYLSFRHNLDFSKLAIEDILKNSRQVSTELTSSFKPLPLFRQYLQEGYFPFIYNINNDSLKPRLLQILNTVLESDLAYVQDYSASHVDKIKKLLGVIASSAPFEPNISKIARKLHLGRNTVYNYLRNLHDAQILRLISRMAKGTSRLQKPDKIYFENPTFTYALRHNPEIGTVRETFFLNQVHNAGHTVHLDTAGDFIVDGQWIFEIGGKNKDSSQIAGLPNAWLVPDDTEVGHTNRIPLWLFGFLY